MKHSHFNTFQPHCPTCKLNKRPPSLLTLQIRHQNTERVLEGQLHCPACQTLFPIIHGVPILVPDVESYLQQSILHAVMPLDESSFVQQWLTESTGPSSAYTLTRQYISTYAEAHYSHNRVPKPQNESGFVELASLAANPCTPNGLALDIGCSVGGSTFRLANQTENLVLGIDISLSMIRFAHQALQGQLRYGRRRIGTVYDMLEYAIDTTHSERIDFWVADALSLPFAETIVDHTQSIHLLDCVATPSQHLIELVRVLKNGGSWSLVCPYDWSLGATSYNEWLGGYGYFHSHNGEPEAVLRWLLSPQSPHTELQVAYITAEFSEQPWRLPIHSRSIMHYQSHVINGRVKR